MCVSSERQEIRGPLDDINSPFIAWKYELLAVNRNWGQSEYLEVADYQLFVVNTEEKRIGFYV